MKTLADCVQHTIKGDDPWALEWTCRAIVCSGLSEHLCRIGQPIADHELLKLAAQAVNFVDHFEHDFAYVDFFVKAESSDGDWVDVRVSLEPVPEPLALVTLTSIAQAAVRLAEEVAA